MQDSLVAKDNAIDKLKSIKNELEKSINIYKSQLDDYKNKINIAENDVKIATNQANKKIGKTYYDAAIDMIEIVENKKLIAILEKIAKDNKKIAKLIEKLTKEKAVLNSNKRKILKEAMSYLIKAKEEYNHPQAENVIQELKENYKIF